MDDSPPESQAHLAWLSCGRVPDSKPRFTRENILVEPPLQDRKQCSAGVVLQPLEGVCLGCAPGGAFHPRASEYSPVAPGGYAAVTATQVDFRRGYLDSHRL